MMTQLPEDFFDCQYEDLRAQLNATGDIKQFSAEFALLKTDKDRVEFLLKNKFINDCIEIPEQASAIKKSSDLSAKLRNEGNKLFQKKRFVDALGVYTTSLCQAPQWRQVGPKEKAADAPKLDLSLAYANRSAALYHLKLHQECLSDIQNALDNGYPQDLRYKLYDRQGKCLIQTGCIAEATQAFHNGKEALQKHAILDNRKKTSWRQDLNKQIDKCKSLGTGSPTVKNKSSLSDVVYDKTVPCFSSNDVNEVFSSLSEACDVVSSPGKGRFLVAKRDINPGDVVLIEKPFASVVLPDQSTTHCHHCFSFCPALVPCFKCSQAAFCGDKCRLAANQTYHTYECNILDIIYKSGVGKFGLLAMRTVTTLGLKGLLQFQQRLQSGELQHESETLKGCNEKDLYLANDYHTIYNLVTHAEHRAVPDLFRRGATAVFLLKCLQTTGFFQDDATDYAEESGFLSFVGGLLLSHLQSFPCNAHEISELELDPHAVASSLPCELGAGIYSTLSLFNHSCDPLVNRNFYGDMCVVRAIRAIRQGEEVADNYGAVYAVQNREDRQAKLKLQYYFECGCDPCIQKWPLYPDIEDTNPVWKCSVCACPIHLIQATTAIKTKCGHCGAENATATKCNALAKAHAAYKEALNKLLACDVEGALPVLLRYLSIADECLRLPWRDHNICQEAVKQCYSIMGNCHAASK